MIFKKLVLPLSQKYKNNKYKKINMNRNKKIVLAIVIVAILGIIAVGYGILSGDLQISESNLAKGDKNILVLCADESEPRPGLGAVDMAFVINLKNGNKESVQPFYPGGMRHPSASEPAVAQAQGAGPRLLLHDSLWDADNSKGMELAKEIVEYHFNTKIDAVIAINNEAMDSIIDASGLPESNESISAADLVRENDQLHGGTMNRADAVMALVDKLTQAAKNPQNRDAMIKVAIDQANKGNIVSIPQNAFVQFILTKTFQTLVANG
ncbi:MAG: DUF4012 domain-containing protein [Methanobrevibacter sp.]|jgi:hypothetical protein|nr:DUF4012 domain-containing protein [Candidatus Methanoflexus mossambicus]